MTVAVRPLPRGQRIRQSLGPLDSDPVPCSTSSNILRAPPSGPQSPHSSSLLKGDEQGRQQQQKGRRGVRRACSRTLQVQGIEGLVAVPGAVRPLPRAQRIRQSLGPLSSDAAPCSTSSNILRAPPSGPESHTSSLLKGDEQGRQQQKGRRGVRRACSRTKQVQGVEGLVAVPGAVRPLPRGQRIRQSLGPLSSDLVRYSTSSNILRAPPSGLSSHSSSPLEGGAVGSAAAARGEEGFREHVAALVRPRVLRASLQCQVPSDPSRGASASARALAPSAPNPFPAAPAATLSGRLPQALSHHTAHIPPQRGQEGPAAAAKGRGGVRRACSRTCQDQGVEGLIAVPGAVRPLPRGQRIRQGLAALCMHCVSFDNDRNIAVRSWLARQIRMASK